MTDQPDWDTDVYGQPALSDDPATIERVAKALYASAQVGKRYAPIGFDELPEQYGEKPGTGMQEMWREQARAAVRALQGEA